MVSPFLLIFTIPPIVLEPYGPQSFKINSSVLRDVELSGVPIFWFLHVSLQARTQISALKLRKILGKIPKKRKIECVFSNRFHDPSVRTKNHVHKKNQLKGSLQTIANNICNKKFLKNLNVHSKILYKVCEFFYKIYNMHISKIILKVQLNMQILLRFFSNFPQ